MVVDGSHDKGRWSCILYLKLLCIRQTKRLKRFFWFKNFKLSCVSSWFLDLRVFYLLSLNAASVILDRTRGKLMKETCRATMPKSLNSIGGRVVDVWNTFLAWSFGNTWECNGHVFPTVLPSVLLQENWAFSAWRHLGGEHTVSRAAPPLDWISSEHSEPGSEMNVFLVAIDAAWGCGGTLGSVEWLLKCDVCMLGAFVCIKWCTDAPEDEAAAHPGSAAEGEEVSKH